MKYNSIEDTEKHRKTVTDKLHYFISEINLRAFDHDRSKMFTPEKEIFDEYTPKLKETTYGSDEYIHQLVIVNVDLFHKLTEKYLLMDINIWKADTGEEPYEVYGTGYFKEETICSNQKYLKKYEL